MAANMLEKGTKRKQGRPSEYTDEIAGKICEGISDGRSLRSICLADDMPDKATVFRWLGIHESFRDQYARARQAQADAIFDEILDIADNPMMGEKRKVMDDGREEVTYGDMIEHRKLQVDVRKWMAGKLRPKVYGDVSTLDVTVAADTGVLRLPEPAMSGDGWANLDQPRKRVENRANT